MKQKGIHKLTLRRQGVVKINDTHYITVTDYRQKLQVGIIQRLEWNDIG